MKALLFVLTVIALTLAVSVSAAEVAGSEVKELDWYYVSPCQQPEGVSLHHWLATLPWHGELELGGWDCSQLSTYIEWLAENCGYHSVITCRKGTEESTGHCWVVIDGDPYEATGLYWINLDTADPGYYEADVWFQDIYEAWDYLPSYGAWGWWKTYPILRR